MYIHFIFYFGVNYYFKKISIYLSVIIDHWLKIYCEAGVHISCHLVWFLVGVVLMIFHKFFLKSIKQ